MTLPYLDRESVLEVLPMSSAVEALRAFLRGGFDPEGETGRTIVSVPAGQILFMPSANDGYAGAKLVTVAPGNDAHGLPRVQGTYLLLDGATLSPRALLDGSALTALRTPAVSALAMDRLARPDAHRMVVFGTGPQARGHVQAARLVRPIREVGVVGRTPERAEEFVRSLRDEGLTVDVATAGDVAGCDVVVCATNARQPLFRGDAVPAGTLVVAVGSHEPGAREVDTDLVQRAVVTVESRRAALAEAGDLLLAIRSGRVGPECVAGNLADVLNGHIAFSPDRPHLFKSVGMAWEDLAVAAAAFEAAERGRTTS